MSRTIDTPAARTEYRHVPQYLGASAEAVVAARGHGRRLKSVFARSYVPMFLVDDDRRYVDVNRPARLAFRLSLAEMRKLRIDDLTPREEWPTMEAAWSRLMTAGVVAGPYEIASPDGGRWDVHYYALKDALPGLHVIAFAPLDTLDGELVDSDEELPKPLAALTERELELLQHASEGLSGPRIAEELVLSPATVKKHFENIYAKLGVGDRAAAVATAMRHGLIS